MIPILTLRAVLLAAAVGVQSLSVVPEGDRTAVLIETSGNVTYQHQMLSGPPRIVVDVSGAEFQLPSGRFLDINRGGVLALRSSRFQAGVVRVVIDLAESVDYEVQQSGGTIRVTFPNPSGPFTPWSSGAVAAAGDPAGMLGEPVAEERPARADRPARAVPVTAPPVVEARAQAQPQQPPITVEFRNTPIVDVLGTFADFSGRSIIPGQGVQDQTITATIQQQPWDEALRAILEGQGLTARELPSGIIMVTSLQQMRTREEQEETVTRSFDLSYVSADSIAPQIRLLLQRGEGAAGAAGTVAVNRATNTLIVSARASTVEHITNLLPTLDRPTPQVTIKARILFVNRTQIEGLGIRYEIKDSRETMLNRIVGGFMDEDGDGVFEPEERVPVGQPVVNFSGATIAAVGNANERIDPNTFEMVATLLLGRHSLIAWLEAVQRLNLSEVQAEPVVTVMDHKTARVQVGERTPIRVVDPGAATAQGPQAQVQTEETGVILEVTPHVVGNQVRIQLHAERSLVLEASADEGYRFGTQETQTEILLNDGETAVISGLTITDFLEERSGIPILMNLPLVGALFQRQFRNEIKQDLLIMVTPFIERDDRL